MPLWKVYHSAHAFSAEDKQELAERITSVYAGIPIPKFYAVVIFEEMTPPFESIAEKRWVAENKASPYTYQEKLPAGQFLLTPGVTG